MTGSPLILASASETRRKMLAQAGLAFDAKKPMADEQAIKAALIADQVPPRDIADALAETKARSLSLAYPDSYVIGSDQILDHEGRIQSKSRNLSEARTAIIDLAGSTHKLHSAVVIMRGETPLWRHVETASLTMRDLTFKQIDSYLAQIGDSALWSVGSYQVEDRGIQLFEEIQGDFFTILGMPLLPLLKQLRHYGFDSTLSYDMDSEPDAPKNDN